MMLLPLLKRGNHDHPVAWRDGKWVSRAQFLGEVRALSRQLPERQFVFNLCTDRYHFLTSFCAALLRGQTNLLPPNHADQTLLQMHARYPEAYAISDRGRQLDSLETVTFPETGADQGGGQEIPEISARQVAAIAFTSGSTGEPQPHHKTWGSLVRQAELQGDKLGIGTGFHFLGTVPPQHMYGLESTLMLPLHSGGTLHAGQPLFPADIRIALEELPEPRVFVTTPLHLRVCLEHGITLPPLAQIISAAAPLSSELAQRAEDAFGAPLLEIFGCTEAGAIAARRTVDGEQWETLAGIRVLNDGTDQAWVEGGHLTERTALQDIVELSENGARFRLLGRKADLVNIAGKRASLAALNLQLNQIPGVRDGVFFAPDDQSGHATRLAALVVAPEMAEEDILAALRLHLDPAFLPRPLFKVDTLPRTTTGKLPREALGKLLAELQHD